MSKTKSRDIKNEIIFMATKLFYDKGYHNTTISDIAKALHTSNGHVSYYFNTKEDIGSMIYVNYSNRIKDVVKEKMTEKYGGYDDTTATAIEFRLTNLLYKTYPNAFRFYDDMVSVLFTNISRRGPEKILSIARQYNLDWADSEADLVFFAWSGAVASIIVQYFKGNINISYEEFDDRRVALPFQIAGVPSDRVTKIVKESKVIFNELDFKILPYFNIR